MAKSLPEVLTREQLLTVLAVIGVVSVIVITALLVVTKATVVELDLRLNEVSLTVVPPRHSAVDLFEELEVRDLQWKGADRFEAILQTPKAGRATAELERSSVVGLGFDAAAGSDAAAFKPVVRLRRPVRLKLEPSGYEGSLTITLEPVAGNAAWRLGFGSEPAPGDWLCQVPTRGDFELRLQDVELAVGNERFLDPTARLEPAAAAILILGGTRRAELGLKPVLGPQGGTTVSVLDLQTGEVAETGKGLPLKLPQERMLVPVGERLVVLEREPADPEAGALLAPNLVVLAPSFFRGDLALREQSFLRGGQVRFPGGASLRPS